MKLKDILITCKINALTISLLVLFFSAGTVMAAKSLGFGEVVDHLDLGKKTSLHVKTYWQKIEGQTVTWTATVEDVSGGRGKAKILASNDSKRTYRGYNMVLVTYDVETAADLSIGDKIKFKGELHNYKGKKGRPVIIYLDNVEFLK